jgi:hypothetical protein
MEQEQMVVGEGDTATTDGGGEVDAIRQLVLLAYPDAVPELIQGDSVAEIIGSVDVARAAFARVAEQMKGSQREPLPPAVPAGGSGAVVDPDRLPPVEKIRRAIAR